MTLDLDNLEERIALASQHGVASANFQLSEIRQLIRLARLAQDWVSVEERLPESDSTRSGCSKVVLVYGAKGFIGPRRYWYSAGGFGQIDGTHWMQLPAPPASAEKEKAL